MPRAHTRGTAKARTISDVDPTVFDLKQLFPKKEGFEQGPLPEQRQVYEWITSGAARDGGIVYQGGKGSAKTLCGAGAIIMSHLIWPKLRSVVGRETYASLCTSTWIDFRDMLERVPKYHIAAVSAPSKNSMGYVEWKNGGTTLFVSLSDNKTWESANIGLAWPDEGHLQNPEMVSKLQERIRQTNDKADPAQDFPRVMLITTNPFGKGWIYQLAHPKSKRRLPDWLWIEAATTANPFLPPGYIKRMEAKHPPGTLSHKRWVLGQSTQLEGAVFGEIFDPEPQTSLHIVKAFPVSKSWRLGRGLDWGVDNPCAVVWAGEDDSGNMWVYRCHRRSKLPAEAQAEIILELEKDEDIMEVPSDPEIFRKIHPDPYQKKALMSTADMFKRAGCRVTPANNNRKYGIEQMFEYMTPDDDRMHPITLQYGSPKIFFMDTPEIMDHLVQCLEHLEWVGEARTGNTGSPDDIKKKDDHEFDALRYRIASKRRFTEKAPIRWKDRRRGRTVDIGYRGYD